MLIRPQIYRGLIGVNSLLPQNIYYFPLRFCGVMDMMKHCIPHVRLHSDCTISEERLLDARYVVIDRLYELQTEIRDVPMEEPVLGNLYEALVRHDKHAEIPTHPRREKEYGGDHNTHEKTEVEKRHSGWIVGLCVRQNKGIERPDE
jgi:hypothetical protein